MQLKIKDPRNKIFEWIPYSQFSYIKKALVKNDFTIYLAIWKDGPLIYNKDKKEYIRSQNKKIYLKYFHNLQNKDDEFLNKVCNYFVQIGYALCYTIIISV
jgi:hypothetical protein